MPIASRSTNVRAKPTGLGQSNGDGAYAHGSNVAGPRADGGEQESPLAEQRGLGNNLAERRVRVSMAGEGYTSWPCKCALQIYHSRSRQHLLVSRRFHPAVVGASSLENTISLATSKCFLRTLDRHGPKRMLELFDPTERSTPAQFLKEWAAHYNQGRPHSNPGPGIPDGPATAFPLRATSDSGRSSSRVSTRKGRSVKSRPRNDRRADFLRSTTTPKGPVRHQRDLQLTRRATRARLSGEREAQNGNSG